MNIRRRLRRLVLFTPLFLSVLPPIDAGTLTAVRDNHVQDGVANSDNVQGNAGSDPTMFIAVRATPYNRKAYVGFDVTSALQPGESFADATLTLTTAGLLGTAQSYTTLTFNVHGLTGDLSWDESTITWNNAPYNDTANARNLVSSGSVLLGTFTVNVASATNASHVFGGDSDVLDTYLNWSAGLLGDHYGTGVTSLAAPTIVITAADAVAPDRPGISIYTSEAANASFAPVISFSTATIPEPASAGVLAGVAALGVLATRRRQQP